MNLPAPIKKMPEAQKYIGKLLIAFFSLALVFTLVSRGLDSFSVATVSTIAPGRGGLSRKLTVEGTVQPLAELAVAAPEGFLVQRTMVEEGSRVQAGDVLAVLDMESLEQQLADAKRELEKARLTAAVKQSSPAADEPDDGSEAALQLRRAKEDLKTTKRNNEENVEGAYQPLAAARHSRNKLYESEYDEDVMDAANQEIASLERAYEQAVQTAEKALIDAERAVEDAERAIEQAERDREKAAEKQAEEAKVAGMESRISSLDSVELERKVAKLEALVASGGEIIADRDGIVTKNLIEAGGVTGAGGAFLLGDREAGAVFRGVVDADTGKRLAPGDAVEIALPGLQPVKTEIEAVKPPEEKGGDYTVTAALPDADIDPGVSGTLNAEKKSAGEGILVPLSALYSDGGTTSGYVFVLREKNTTMGMQTVVEKIAVEIIDKSDKSALVEGPLTSEDRIVDSSSRSLVPGDRVREETV